VLKQMKKTVIIDFQSGNLFSVLHACRLNGLDPVISDDVSEIADADGLILPGVGAFARAMEHLDSTGISQAIRNHAGEGKPFLGICLGLQLLFDESEEFGSAKGLGLVSGKVKKLHFDDPQIKIPHVGWNRLIKPDEADWSSSLFKNLQEGDYMYFVHSFYVEPSVKSEILAETIYEGKRFCSAIMKNNIFATQFHPEKSGEKGLSIVREFAEQVLSERRKYV
jgi:imidazole glycerol-phosphate synthase subunit HisH